jgi:MFS family permease
MDKHIRAIVFLVAGAAFMEMLDGTAIVTALPRMGQVFGVTAIAMNLGITAYLLAVAVCLPASGWAAERYGVRRVFAGGLVLFTLASLFCAFSQGLGEFVGARVLQGMGGSAMVSVGRLAVLRVIPKHQMVHAIGTIIWPGLIAPVVGPALGGFLVTYISWRWIFAINLPLGLLALAAALRLMPTGHEAQARGLDLRGLALLGLVLATLVGGANGLGDGDVYALWALVASAVLAGLTWWHCRRHPAPLLQFAALRHRSFSVGVVDGSAFRIAINSAPFLLPLFFQLVLGYNAFHAGLLLLALFAGNLLMKTSTTRTLRVFDTNTAVWSVALVLFLGGLSRSLQFTALNTLQFADVPQCEMGAANTLSNLAQQLSMGLGPTFGSLCLDFGTALGHREMPDLADFRLAFILSALLALAGLAGGFRLAQNVGQAVSGHRPA